MVAAASASGSMSVACKIDLIKRVEATQRTVHTFKGKVFEDGRWDCIQMAVAHAKNCGQKITVPSYSDVEGAARALKQLGFRSLGEAMDSYFQRINTADVLVSDFVECPGTNGFSSIMVALGNGRTLGFHESIPHADILQPLLISGAWRIE